MPASSAEKQSAARHGAEEPAFPPGRLPLENESELNLDQSSERSGLGEIDHDHIVLALDERMQSDLSAIQNQEEPSPSIVPGSQLLRSYALNPALDKEGGSFPTEAPHELPMKSPGSETPAQSEKRSSNELDKYLDDDISQEHPVQPRELPASQEMNIEDCGDPEQKSPDQRQQVQEMNQVAEMAITSNLTTLNLDGDNTSGEGEGAQRAGGLEEGVPGGPDMDDEELQQLKDKKYLDQFRKRQNRLNSKKPEQQLELNQIEIEIQENSDPTSPQKPPIQVALTAHPAGTWA